MGDATTKPNHTTVNTKPNDGMKNAKRWESLLNALLYKFIQHRTSLGAHSSCQSQFFLASNET
ncbi:hypothetical protein VCHA53O473_480002 [Vibrio chagasii]|nr:hypothetical protein VCHA43P275_410002 [Vibrio chagasii]CAH7331610.1 hypothetical protein VCHA53O473_480002 [Vibrio chagasii]